MTEIVIKKEKDQLLLIKQSVQQLVSNCNSISITDETTLAVAQNILGKANDKLKESKKLTETLQKPYYKSYQEIFNLGKEINAPLETAVLAGKQKIIAYDQHKKALADKEAKRIQGIRNEIQRYSAAAIEEFKNAATEIDLINANTLWVKDYKFPETWNELNEELKQVRINLHNYAKQRQIEINTPEQADETASEEIEATVQHQTANVGSFQMSASSAEKTRGVGGTWKHRVDNKALVPANFLMVDDAAVKEYIKQNKDNIQNPSFKIPGVEFYFEPTVRL